MSIDLSNKENLQLLGKRLLNFVGEWDNKATIVYAEGIPLFDMELSVHKFSETDCRICIELFENGMIFRLIAKYGSVLKSFGIWNKDMLSMEMVKDVPITVPGINGWERIRPLASVIKAIGYATAVFRKDNTVRTREFSIIGSTEAIGWVMKLYYTDDNDGSIKTMTFNILKDYHNDILETIFNKHWNNSKNF